MARTADPELAERRRREIMEAAIACFRRAGFHQTGMQAICAEAGISAGALYRYFGSKAEIIAAIAEEDRLAVAQVLAGALTSGVVLEDLQRSAELIVERHSGQGKAALIADVIGESVRDPALGARLAQIDAEAAGYLAQALARAQQKGEVDPSLDPKAAAHVLFATLDGLMLRMAILGPRRADSLLEDFHTLAQRYLAPRGPHEVA